MKKYSITAKTTLQIEERISNFVEIDSQYLDDIVKLSGGDPTWLKNKLNTTLTHDDALLVFNYLVSVGKVKEY